MKNTKIFASAALVATLLSAAPALADSGKEDKHEGGDYGLHLGSFVRALAHERNDTRKEHKEHKDHHHNDGLNHISGRVATINGTTLTIDKQNGTIYTVNAASSTIVNGNGNTLTLADVKVADFVQVKGTLTGTLITATTIKDFGPIPVKPVQNGVMSIGVISSISGSVFTINPTGAGSTTTVETNVTTLFRGGATSSQSLTTGSTVLVLGTTSSSTPSAISASLVVMFKDGFHFLKNLFVH